MEPIYQNILATITSFIISFTLIPSIIKVAELKNLFDEPDSRKKHTCAIPTLGGIAIFAGFTFSVCFWSNQQQILELQYIISALIVMFFMGIKDDIINLVAYKKLLGQFIAAIILVTLANIKFTSFYGIFGIYEISNYVAIPFSVFVIIAITNSINLIDGIDTLAGAVGIISNSAFGLWFYLTGNYHYSLLAFAMLGSLVAFLYFNKTPAKIFMGDTGSLILGIVLAILAIKFIELNRIYHETPSFKIHSAPSVAISILIIPIFDTLRVFTLRALQGKSPLSADREHIHHIITDLGFSHIKASIILITINTICIIFTFIFMHINAELLLTLNFLFLTLITSFLSRKRKVKVLTLKKVET